MMANKVVLLLLLSLFVTSSTILPAAEISDTSKFDAAIASQKTAADKAIAAYDALQKTIVAKRQQSVQAKKNADGLRSSPLKQAEKKQAFASKMLAEAKKAKVPKDKALAAANAAVSKAEQAFGAADKAAKDIARPEQEKKPADAQVVAKRKAADSAKAVLNQAIKKQADAKKQAKAAEQKVTQAASKKKLADEVLTKVKGQIAAEIENQKTADKAVKDAEGQIAKAKEAVDKAQIALAAAKKASVELLPPIEKARAKAQYAEEVSAAAVAAVVPAKNAMQKADKAYTDVKKVTDAKRQKANASKKYSGQAGLDELKKAEEAVPITAKAAEDATNAIPPLDKVLSEARVAAGPLQKAYDKAAKELVKAEVKERKAYNAVFKNEIEAKKASAKAAAKRRAVREAKSGADNTALLAEIEKFEKIAKEKSKAADETTKKIAAVIRSTFALANAQKAHKQAQDKTATQKKLDSAVAADKAARAAAGDLVKRGETYKQAKDEVTAKRTAVRTARSALDPKAKKLEAALTNASSAKQKLERAKKDKKSAEDNLANLKKRIEAAKKSHEADENAAVESEAKATPLKAEAVKTRAAYEAASDVANKKLALAHDANAVLYRLVSAGQIASIMDSPDAPQPGNKIDELVFAKLESLGIKPVLCSDAVFIRRAFLDLTGRLPTADEAKTFILDKDLKKRTALIDSLLEKTSHADYWAMRWSDIFRIKAEFPVKVWPNGAQVYHRWVWESIAQNKPYDQFVRELLTSSGSNFRVGAVNFYRAIQDKTPEGIAASVGMALMGTRLFNWPEDRRANMALFFTQIGYKPTSEWKEEIIFWDPLASTKVPGCNAPGDKAVAETVKITNKIPKELDEPLDPNGPLAVVFPDGTKMTIPADRDPREVFADWLVKPENPWFAKSIVNRTWAWAMGQGIIHEPDDIRDDNPPSNPELLAYLEKELVASGYDMKHLKRLIFSSTTYQFSSVPRVKTPEAKANFASYPLRRVGAEVLIDTVNQITGSSDLYTSAVPEPFTYIPKHMSAVELADGSITSSFLMLFGRSARATGMENERVNELASRQWLHMLNSVTMQQKLQSGYKLKRILSKGAKQDQIVENLYLTILSRFPTKADLEAADEYVKSGVAKGHAAWFDLAWALMNNPEFLLRH